MSWGAHPLYPPGLGPFSPPLAFPNIEVGNHFSQPPSSTSYHQPSGSNHQNEFVRPGIPASTSTNIIAEPAVRLGSLGNADAGGHIGNIGVVGQNDRDRGINRLRQPPSRKPRARQPGEAQWQKNKARIHKLYMKEDLPLPEVVLIMERDHNFIANEKAYKKKFSAWGWHKNLSRAEATWMGEKIKQRRQKQPPAATVFERNHHQWSEDKVMQICARNAQSEPRTAGPATCAATPNEMKYWTPRDTAQTPRDTAQTPRDIPAAQPQYPERHQSPTIPRKFYLDRSPVNLDMTQTTISDLRKLLVSATQAASSGNQDEADADFRDAVSGFRQLLSPIHEETIKAAYFYASFYANSGKMDKADAVLSWITEKHQDKWGPEHEKTYLHYARMIELLRSWGLKEQAENLVYKLMEGLDDDGAEVNLSLSDLSGHQHRPLFENVDNLAETFPETDDAGAIRHQLDRIELAVMTDITGLEGVLQTIIRHCDEGDSEELALQACRAKCALARRFWGWGQAGDAIRVLKSGRSSLGRLLEISEEPVAHSTVRVARRLALTFFEAKDKTSCNGVIDEVIMALEVRLSLPGCRVDTEKKALLDFVVSTAFHFHQKSAFDNCRHWIKRALGLAIKRFGRKSREALRLRKTLQRKDFDMRTPGGLAELMGFSQGQCVDFDAEELLLFLPDF